MSKLTWKVSLDGETRVIHSAARTMARNHLSGNAVQIELGLHYNGGGAKAFGGARQWPHLKLDIDFSETGAYERAVFFTKLRKFLEDNL